MMPESRIAPPVTPAEAMRIARQLYGLEVDTRPFPGEYDDNFHLLARGGRAFVLKVMHPGREESFVDMQCSALTYLAEHAPHLALPRVSPTSRGELFTRAKLDDGSERLVWLLTFVPGTALADTHPHSPELLESLGGLLAEIDTALLNFSHSATQRSLKWDLSHSNWIRDYLPHIHDPQRRSLVEHFLNLFEQEAVPRFPRLRHSVIYGDANDHNALVFPILGRVAAPLSPHHQGPQSQASTSSGDPRRVVSVIDFGDMHRGLIVAEPAIAAAYAVLAHERPLPAASSVLVGYHRILPLNEEEIAVFFPLLATRLAVSVVNSAHRQSLVPDDPYVTITESRAWAALERLTKIHPRFAHYTFRVACGLAPVQQAQRIHHWIKQHSPKASSIIPQDLRSGPSVVLDLSVGSTFLGADPANAAEPIATPKIQALLRSLDASVAVGRYDEARVIYTAPLFAPSSRPTDERRTVHLGIDLFVDPGTPISAPFDAIIYAIGNNTAPSDYGPVVILRHQPEPSIGFFTLYGHLSSDTLAVLKVGQPVSRGETFAHIGHAQENGGWSPHLHFQIILDLLDLGTDFPGVSLASERSLWTNLSPDPNLILGIPSERFPENQPSLDATLSLRKDLLGKNLSLSYRRPLKLVRGWMQYVFDDTGRAFLDIYNNVPLVGHSHPHAVRAVQEQLALLNINTRYLHDNVLRYAERLTRLLPAPLSVCYFLNSGSEANELALRLARTHTGREDVIVLEHAYHGHTSTLIDISPYKFNGPGGRGQKPWVHVAPLADDYRGPYRRGQPELGKKYAGHVAEILERLKREGRSVAAYIAETLPSVAGQIVFPPDYLGEVYQHVRSAGAVCIADEVQVGFGRLGTKLWGFETQSVVPDIVVLGKPIGNAFPLAAVVTTPEIAASFANGMEFFSTFGGNPVACAAGLAVLDVLEQEQLQQNALCVGTRWMRELQSLQSRRPLIGDVRGSGLFLGIDLVNNPETRAPAADQASYVVNRLRELGILAGTDGPHHNVLKLRPPLIFSDADADLFTATLASVLSEDPAQPFF
jgi:4-aminobutyrate aminotransferase-like enzyme/Ser/Thr protein kinase RdoA (MazF antagonist)